MKISEIPFAITTLTNEDLLEVEITGLNKPAKIKFGDLKTQIFDQLLSQLLPELQAYIDINVNNGIDNINNVIENINNSISTKRIGTTFDWFGDNIPEGSLELNGARLPKEEPYMDLYNTGLFADNGDGTFTLADTRDRVTRGASATRAPSGTEEDAIQNITGSFTVYDYSGGSSGGVFGEITTNNQVGTFAANVTVFYKTKSFDASKVVRTATETRVKSIFAKKCIWYK